MSRKVLFVDDDDNLRASVHRTFRNRYDLDLASGGPEGLRALEEHGPYAVVVADLSMPGMDGLEFLRQCQATAPDTVRIMFSGHAGTEALMEAINGGQVFRFVQKPCRLEDLARAVDEGLLQSGLATAERELLEATLSGSVRAITGMLETLDPAVFLSARILSDRSARVARALGLKDAWSVGLAALFSPLWILPLPASLRARLASGAELEAEAEQTLAEAVARAASVVREIPRLEEVARAIQFLGPLGGQGTPPENLERMPLPSRILQTVWDFNAVEARVKSKEVALEALRLRPGMYDLRVLAALASELGLRAGS